MQTLIKMFKKPITSTLISILLGFIVLTIILMVSGYNAGQTYDSLFNGIFGRPKYISNLIIRSTPIILTGLGVAFAYKTGLFNIGAEGQFIMGQVLTIMVGTTLNLHPVIMIPFMIIVGTATGAVWGGICGYLKARFGINEVITSIMLNWVALYFNNFIAASEAFHQPNSMASKAVAENARIGLLSNWKMSDEGLETLRQWPYVYDFLVRTDVNFGIVIAVVMCFVISYLLYKTQKGFELRAVGLNKDAAEFAGINVKSSMVQAMLISGAICGLAGVVMLLGTSPNRISQLSAFENHGFNGLAVAFISMGSPIGCIFSGLLFGGLLYGGQSVQMELGLPSEIVNIMIGTIIFFVALASIMPIVVTKLEKWQYEKKNKIVKEVK